MNTYRNDPCEDAADRLAHGPHNWDGDLGDEGYECWGYPVPDVVPEMFRPVRKDSTDE